ncbi:MAG: aminodeoxychorismate/anthranilate synthase component II [Aquisalinus sp.]|nr:aminodeoxychorismate/anthranilate synthase component II [Aquisalinus sp.]
MILVVDNYDSFVHNLARYVRELDHETCVVRNDSLAALGSDTERIKGIILSPGPGRPQSAGGCLELILQEPAKPILGVCLGHQCLAEAYGGKTVSALQPMHGRASLVRHDGQGLFQGLANPMQAGRYHSLASDLSGASDLNIQAYTDDGEVMAFSHQVNPHYGVQFHPESLLTPEGKRLIKNFLDMAGKS